MNQRKMTLERRKKWHKGPRRQNTASKRVNNSQHLSLKRTLLLATVSPTSRHKTPSNVATTRPAPYINHQLIKSSGSQVTLDNDHHKELEPRDGRRGLRGG